MACFVGNGGCENPDAAVKHKSRKSPSASNRQGGQQTAGSKQGAKAEKIQQSGSVVGLGQAFELGSLNRCPVPLRPWFASGAQGMFLCSGVEVRPVVRP